MKFLRQTLPTKALDRTLLMHEKAMFLKITAHKPLILKVDVMLLSNQLVLAQSVLLVE